MIGYPSNYTNTQQKKSYKDNRKHIIIVICILMCCIIIISLILSNTNLIHNNSSNFSLNIDFSNRNAQSQYTEDELKTDFGEINSVIGLERLSMTNQGLNFLLPTGKSSPKESGSKINVPIPQNDEYTIEYNIYFEDGFDWACGGILCGLSGGTYYDGDTPSSFDNGFNITLSWDSYGSIIPRLFHEGQVNPHGDIYDIVGTFKTGKWYKIKMYVKINSQYESNGILKMSIDDKECLSKDCLNFSSKDIKIDSAIIQASHYSFINKGNTKDQSVTIGYVSIKSKCDLSGSDTTPSTNNNYSSNEYAFNLPKNTPDTDGQVVSPSTAPTISSELLSTASPTSVACTQNTVNNTSTLNPQDKPLQAKPSKDPPQQTANISFELIDNWNTGYSSYFVIKNNSSNAITNWAIEVNASDFNFNSLWNARYTKDGDKYYIIPTLYNYYIEPYQSIYIGFCSYGVYNNDYDYSLIIDN